MKKIKILSLLLVCVLLFTACSAGGGSNIESTDTTTSTINNSVQLTTDNASQYLNFNLHGYPSDYDGYYFYEKLVVTGSISGIAGYTYNNVSVKLSVKFTFDKKWSNELWSTVDSCSVEIATQLNLGGNGNVSVEEAPTTQNGVNLGSIKNVECLGYTITSVTGSVTKG